MEFNNDMDKYLRGRRRSKSFYDNKKSWWSKMFDKPEEIPKDELSPAEAAKLESMEHEIKKGEAKIEKVQAREHELEAAEMELEDEQEEKVSIYQKFRNLFQREHKVEQEYEEVQMAKEQAVALPQ
jgi:predicted RNase H-like nuclease (RuvC/YqgF family)